MKKYVFLFLFFLFIVLGISTSSPQLATAPALQESTTQTLPHVPQATDTASTLPAVTNQAISVQGAQPKAVASHTDITPENILYWTNIARKENGVLSPLTKNQTLDKAALAKAHDILLKQYFDHVSPSGVDVKILVQSTGYDFIVVGENLALGNFKDAESVVDAWMKSPGHRANILKPGFAELGAAGIEGVYEGRTAWVVVQEFGTPTTACPKPDNVLKEKIALYQDQIAKLKETLAKTLAVAQTLSRTSPQYAAKIDEYNSLGSFTNSLLTELEGFISAYNEQVAAFNVCVVNFAASDGTSTP